jgi:multidrug efflux pump subunit AcrA (membrane-fusion protein)
LLAIHDPSDLELHASVGESLAAHLRLGQTLRVRVDATQIDTKGTVREIVPRAEAASRSVLVKVTLPQQPQTANDTNQLYIGMFGRLQIPVGQLDRLVVAVGAVQRIGQLDVVDVVTDKNWLERRYVRLGERFGSDVEILSGVRLGERIALPGSVAGHEASARVDPPRRRWPSFY